MKERLLPYLVCPGCRSPLELSGVLKTEGSEIMEGRLACSACPLSFPISGGVPRILSGKDYRLKEETKRRFAFSWKKFSTIYEDPKDFLDWIHPKTADFFKDKVTLDAGCGSGQHAVFASRFGAREVVAFDLSPVVDVAFGHARLRDNVHVIQADMYRLPLKADFDFIYCIGVLQHLPDTASGFGRLCRLLRPGGWLSVWVYGHEGAGFIRRVVDPLRKAVMSRLPPPVILALSFLLTAALFFLAKVVYGPLSSFRPTRAVVRRLPLGDYISYMSRFDFTYLFNSVFDQLIAPITQYFREADVRGWYLKNGLKDIALSRRNNISWRATGRNPG